MELTREQMENLKSFLLETFAFTEEQNAAMDQQIPMTQEIFESIIERYNELVSAADKIFYRIIMEYPDMTDIYGGKIAKELELDTKYGNMEFPQETPEELQAGWERLCARIRAEYGEDAI